MQNSELCGISERFQNALLAAVEFHRTHYRKGGSIPYISHLMSVTSIVMENSCDEDMWIAALLHDAVEDGGGEITLKQIRESFGERVARLIMDCSDDIPGAEGIKAPWIGRKMKFMEKIPTMETASAMIVLADKIHNIRTLRIDFELHGDAVFERFTAGKIGSLWYYQKMLEILSARKDLPEILVKELELDVMEIAPEPISVEAVVEYLETAGQRS